MKKIIIATISITAVLLILSSCTEDFLERYPISSQSTGTFYETESDFEQAVNACYDGLQNVHQHHHHYFVIWGCRSDEFGPSGYEMTVIDQFTDNETTTYYNGMWTRVFNAIFRCNNLLAESEGISTDDIPTIERFRAEARFLRGLLYFDLVWVFGGMPLYDGNVSYDEYYSIPRSTIAEAYAFIIADFQAAAAALPSEYSGADIGRATSWAAKGFLAKVLLYNEDYSQCLSLCNEIIASNKFQFLPNWRDIFNEDNDNGPQALFQVQYLSGGDGEHSARPGQYMEPQAKTFLGRTFTVPGAAGVPDVSDYFYNSFDTMDVRRNDIARDYLDVNDDPQTGSFCAKFTIGAYDAFDFHNWGVNITKLRYTEVLLMKAECINELSGPTAEAVGIIDQIRARAGLPALLPAEQADQQSFFDAIVRERKFELAFEDNRWFDLVRWGMAQTVVNEYLIDTYFPDFSYQMQSHHVLFPIPEAQLEFIGDESVLWQNPGY